MLRDWSNSRAPDGPFFSPVVLYLASLYFHTFYWPKFPIFCHLFSCVIFRNSDHKESQYFSWDTMYHVLYCTLSTYILCTVIVVQLMICLTDHDFFFFFSLHRNLKFSWRNMSQNELTLETKCSWNVWLPDFMMCTVLDHPRESKRLHFWSSNTLPNYFPKHLQMSIVTEEVGGARCSDASRNCRASWMVCH